MALTQRVEDVPSPSVRPSARVENRRHDIQGLRALAVLVVIADHMFGWPSGGFVGVDVFFVISGFLITGLLLREYESTGHISARAFYLARGKRIVPAASLTLIVTAVAAVLLFAPQRAGSTVGDAVAAFFFVANWNFAIDGTDYFTQSGAMSPVQHFWSLSVEEQFYFVWPWLLLLALTVMLRHGTRTPRRVRWVAGIAITTISLASFGWALVQSASSPTVAYFSTFTRAWELGVGALLAVVAPIVVPRSSKMRAVLSYVGIAGILVAVIFVSPSTAWPAPWAVLPTLATAFVLISGFGGTAPIPGLLTNRVAVYIGDISYSLYLWHFPVIVVGSLVVSTLSPPVQLGFVVICAGLSLASYHLVERPIWRSPLGAKHARSWADWRAETRTGMRRGGAIGVVLLIAGCLFVGIFSMDRDPSRSWSADSSESNAMTELQSEVATALDATAWPTLTPAADELGPTAKVDAWVEDGCLALEQGAEADPRDTARHREPV